MTSEVKIVCYLSVIYGAYGLILDSVKKSKDASSNLTVVLKKRPDIMQRDPVERNIFCTFERFVCATLISPRYQIIVSETIRS